MINVSSAVKEAYKNGSYKKILNISFPVKHYTVPSENIYFETFSLNESIFDEDSFEIVGCIASKLEVTIRDSKRELKGTKIVATITVYNSDSTVLGTIPLFTGYVDTVEREAQKRLQKIVAYDALYSEGSTDVANWYKGLQFPITLGNLRNSLFNMLDLTQETQILPNDSVVINKEYNPNTLTALSVIKALCQINGRFGIVNRNGKFEYREVHVNATPETVSFYRTMDYKDYTVAPVGRLIIRQSTDDVGVTIVPQGSTNYNKYIIQGNMFTYNLSTAQLTSIGNNIINSIASISYNPFSASNNGYPWIECGDSLQYSVYDFDASEESSPHQDIYKDVTATVFNRSLKNIQNILDTYESRGEEYQREFVSDVSADLSVIMQTIEELKQHMSTEISIYKNPTDITIASGRSDNISLIYYESTQGNTVIFHGEVSLIATANESFSNNTYTEGDILATVDYYVDGRRLPNNRSEGLLKEGKNILSLMQFWQAGERTFNLLSVKLKVTGGSVTIPKFRASSYITVKQTDFAEWDIRVYQDPTKLTYAVGEKFNYTGMIILKYYVNYEQPEEDITTQCVFDPAERTTVTQSYIDIADNLGYIPLNIKYTELNDVGESITKELLYDKINLQYLREIYWTYYPADDDYFVGESLSYFGGVIEAAYADGSTKIIYANTGSPGSSVDLGCTFSIPDGTTFSASDIGTKRITVTYTENGITKTNKDLNVYVNAVELESIKIATLPNDTVYKVGETLDYTGLTVEAHYNNRTTAIIPKSQCTFSPAEGSTVTENTSGYITVTYQGCEDGFTIDIVTVVNIKVNAPTDPPLTYEAGETMDFSSITVDRVWSDESTDDITSQCTFSPSDQSPASIEATYVEVRYSYRGNLFTDGFEIDVYEFLGISVPPETAQEYWLGDETDYKDIVVTGTYSNETTEDVTANCTFYPAEGTVTTMGMDTVRISYTRPTTGRTYTTEFSILVKEPEPVLKYLIYTTDATNRIIYVTGLNGDEIASDNLRNLVLPSTYTDATSGITFRVVLGPKPR